MMLILNLKFEILNRLFYKRQHVLIDVNKLRIYLLSQFLLLLRSYLFALTSYLTQPFSNGLSSLILQSGDFGGSKVCRRHSCTPLLHQTLPFGWVHSTAMKKFVQGYIPYQSNNYSRTICYQSSDKQQPLCSLGHICYSRRYYFYDDERDRNFGS